jgi:hypothetical protein
VNGLEAPSIPHLTDARLAALERHLVQEITAKRRHRQRRAFTLGSAGLVAGAATAALAVLLGTSPPAAFAAWTASPTTPAPGQVATAEANCAARPANPPPGAPVLPDKVTVTDTRGPFTLLLFGTNTSEQGALLCMSGPDGTQFSVAEGAQPPPPQAGRITVDRLQGASADGQPYTVAEGSAGSGVSAAALVLSDGTHVVTTIRGGLFLAWWPGRATVTSATVTSASGTAAQAVNSPAVDTGGSVRTATGGANPGNGSLPHTARQRAELRRFCARLKAKGIHGPGGQPIGPCAALSP